MPAVDRVDVANDIDWHESHILLKAAFPLAASSEHATYEIPYGSIERPTTRNNSGSRRNLKCRRCAGPISAMESWIQSDQRLEVRLRRQRQRPTTFALAFAHMA